ncbi:MAG: DUF937 domain-containing protein [Beijerinckiaceae bacterium]
MMNLFEMMVQAQGGNAVNNMARQFGLDASQAQNAMEALLPAFSTGLQQQAATPQGLESLLQMFGGGQYQGFHDADGDGIPDNAQTQGNDILGQLFGGKEVSRAVAAQASAMSGVSSAIIKQMLPVMASMLMGGLFKGAMNNGLGGLMGQAMQGGLGNMMGGMMGGQPQQQAGGGLLGGLLGNLMGGMMGGGRPQPQPQADPMLAGLDMLKGMFDSGQKVQQTQMDALQQIFQQFGGRR